ncbi:MAG: phosphoribosylformylglycinamidine cyclo-ligase [Candidatus Sumerlaeaceae bacterium]
MKTLPRSLSYKDSGVDISEGDRVVDFVRSRNRNIGGFSALMPIPKGYKRPLLVASTDGVGTKLLVAKAAGQLNTIGIDLVAMVVNDLLVCGAKPLFFLDYYATGKLNAREAKQVLEGIFHGCEQAGCPLIGGETAELPGLYKSGDFDLAGFGVGIVEADRVIDGSRIEEGDLVYGFGSSGLHSNGYSLARRALLDKAGLTLKSKVPGAGNSSLQRVLMTPTKIYSALIARLLKGRIDIRGLAHITGGGIPGNLNRVLPGDLDARVEWGSWPVHPIFRLIEQRGPVSRAEMLKTFNMGLGMMAVAPARQRSAIERAAAAAGETVQVVGVLVPGSGQVTVH